MEKIRIYFCLCFILIFISSTGCIGNNPNAIPVSPTPSSSPTPDNILRVYTDTIFEKDFSSFEHSEYSAAGFDLKKDDKLDITITELTGGNRDIDIYIGPCGPTKCMEYHVSRGEGSFSWTVTHDGVFYIMLDNWEYDFSKDLHLKVDLTYIGTEKR